ncbi:uncharacterized protein LOC129581431 [Paramacrobiotus metropolitanus]|uniref:uncharacterized protein LOC129581431 n=1 Tax=Paramacrobiotus metropolitanus TaxID=2943436 RepID=UPI002445DB99|nr:uncharacterized protein LOC129581431 [Paramacrobiotus metropolitanus]XP_055328468.1 uncharacterized protein LOC129581431 [Paramacrobiotus metropolitanus]
MPPKTESANQKNPVHQANYWRDHCLDEVRREARWKAGYGKFLLGAQPKLRLTKEKPLRLPVRGRLPMHYDPDIQVDLSNRFIQRHFHMPQLHSHHVYPQLQSYKVNLPERPLKHIVRNVHTESQPKLETYAPPFPKTESRKYGWLVNGPTYDFPSVGKQARKQSDLAKAVGLPYEAW